MHTILVANAGSSSVKFQVFEIEQGQRLRRQIKGQVDGIGTKPHLHTAAADGKVLADWAYSKDTVPDLPAALQAAANMAARRTPHRSHCRGSSRGAWRPGS